MYKIMTCLLLPHLFGHSMITWIYSNICSSLQNESVTALMNPTAMEYAQRCEGYKKLTRTVMDSIFTVEEMTTCSVTGKKGIVGEKRQSLDKGKVKLVIGKDVRILFELGKMLLY